MRSQRRLSESIDRFVGIDKATEPQFDLHRFKVIKSIGVRRAEDDGIELPALQEPVHLQYISFYDGLIAPSSFSPEAGILHHHSHMGAECLQCEFFLIASKPL